MAKKTSVLLVCASLIGFITAISGCSTIGYYGHVSRGHLSMISKREDIDKLLEQEALDPKLRLQLELVKEARQFAVDQLLLPDNDSYLKYADLERPYVVWNVFAAEKLALTAKQHCFPVAGCVVYRGYYNEEAAKQAASSLEAEGFDVHVGGVAAYSTLGWFDDPLLNTMLRWEDWAVVELIFHELSHQKLYIKNDSSFNEGLATAAAKLGLEQWLDSKEQTELIGRIDKYRQRQQEFNQLLFAARQSLETIYSSDVSNEQKLEQKAALLAELPTKYHAFKDQHWEGWNGFGGWFEKPINNARLLPVATYNSRVPEFVEIFTDCNADWACFWQAAEAASQAASN